MIKTRSSMEMGKFGRKQFCVNGWKNREISKRHENVIFRNIERDRELRSSRMIETMRREMLGRDKVRI